MSSVVVGAIVTILVAGIGVVSHNLEFIVNFLGKYIHFFRYKSNFDKVVSAKLYIDALARGLQGRANIKKASVVAITNGGTIVKPEGVIYGTIIHPMEYIHTFNKEVIGVEYLQMVKEVYLKGQADRKVEDFSDYSPIKNLLISQGVATTKCFSIKEISSKTTFTYLFLAVDIEEGKTLDAEDLNDIRTTVNEIKKLL